ncbi:RMD1 family protein [Rhodocytophaga aerolata]|uniref:RMD1 family protein n=1 Tax=Rhodocytophaga aerolata TaxID=455078 RepID=A0ABT8R715_9BACT|nr:RMD1 family protein [Rhodocytophaga aerolata]MDO1447901.1 RMD1 family protein [Rhodocytophaga aerolata]
MLRVETFLVAEQINVKKFRAEFTGTPHSASAFEAFYAQENNRFLYVLNYGVVGFVGYSDVEKSDFIKFLKNYTEKPVDGDYKEDLLVDYNPNARLTFSYNSVSVPEWNENVVKIIILNIAQSVAMDFYEKMGSEVLDSTRKFTDELEKYGKIRISKTNLMKYIGRTLNVKNNIFDNLYVFNSPDSVWENEFLSKLDHGLRDTFDINMRFRELDYELKIVQDNLALFTDQLQHRESNRLEWIIILLILFEVIDLLISKVI